MATAKSMSGSRVKHLNERQFEKKDTSGLSWFYAHLGVSFW